MFLHLGSGPSDESPPERRTVSTILNELARGLADIDRSSVRCPALTASGFAPAELEGCRTLRHFALYLTSIIEARGKRKALRHCQRARVRPTWTPDHSRTG